MSMEVIVVPVKKDIVSVRYLNKDEAGYIMVTAIFVLAILTITAAAISMLSQTESKTVRSERLYLTEFFNTDSAIAVASEKSTGPDGWGTILNNDMENGYVYTSRPLGESGPATVIEAFRIDESYNNVNSDASAFAKNLPVQKHIDEPLVGSGTGVTGEVMIRRYAITARPADGSVQIQAGVYKYIPGSNI